MRSAFCCSAWQALRAETRVLLGRQARILGLCAAAERRAGGRVLLLSIDNIAAVVSAIAIIFVALTWLKAIYEHAFGSPPPNQPISIAASFTTEPKWPFLHWLCWLPFSAFVQAPHEPHQRLCARSRPCRVFSGETDGGRDGLSYAPRPSSAGHDRWQGFWTNDCCAERWSPSL